MAPSLLLLVLVAFSGCSAKSLQSVPPHKLPFFMDDHTLSSLEKAVSRSMDYLEKLPPDRPVNFSGQTYTVSHLIATLQTFLSLVRKSSTPEAFQRHILEHFEVFQTRDSGSLWRRNKMLITGYFEPTFEGSLTSSPKYRYPLYGVPPDLIISRDETTGEKTIGRLENDRLVPYWTRSEIEKRNLLAGQELVYLADPVDAFVLHVQGSGKIRLRNGLVRGIRFAALNGRPYRSIGRLLVDEGRMSLEEVDLPRIRQYLANHPAERTRILHVNESFVFFRWGDGDGPVGSLGEVLTPGRSVAADQDCFPAGALAFLQSRRPRLNRDGDVEAWVPMSRFVFVQDSGSAIKGTARLDFFWGDSSYAEVAAGRMRQPGKLFFLVEKRPD